MRPSSDVAARTILCLDVPTNEASSSWKESLAQSRHRVVFLSPSEAAVPGWLELDRFDGVALTDAFLTSTALVRPWEERLAKYDGAKLLVTAPGAPAPQFATPARVVSMAPASGVFDAAVDAECANKALAPSVSKSRLVARALGATTWDVFRVFLVYAVFPIARPLWELVLAVLRYPFALVFAYPRRAAFDLSSELPVREFRALLQRRISWSEFRKAGGVWLRRFDGRKPATKAAPDIDVANEAFWTEPCGATLAREHQLFDMSASSLRNFDANYFRLYPYLLSRHFPKGSLAGQKVLEVGLGYGTVAQRLMESGAQYTGLDIARGPLDMVKLRAEYLGREPRLFQGSMLRSPFEDGTFDWVISIGCFHHTGDIARCFDETYRVLKPGGQAILMIYNGLSYRRWARWPNECLRTLGADWFHRPVTEKTSHEERRAYDADTNDAAAPTTAFYSSARAKRLLSKFSAVRAYRENCDPFVARRPLLELVGRAWGLDLYLHAKK